METAHPHTHDNIPAALAGTLPGLFAERCRRSPGTEAYRQFEAAGGGWRSLTWAEVGAQAERWRAALAAEGFSPGDRVAVMLRNSVEWVCFDQAAQGLGLVVVPLYPTDNAENLAYILRDCGARALLLGEAERWQALAAVPEGLPQITRVLCTGPAAKRAV